MENKKLKFEFPFRIVDLKTNSFYIQNLPDEEVERFNPDDIEFGIKPGFGFNDELNVVKVNFNINYSYKGKDILKIDVDTVFEFLPIDKLNIHDEYILATILGISFSTIRGIILNRTIGSFMNNIYLPIINPTEIVAEEFKTKKD